MNDTIQKVTDSLSAIFAATDTALNEWSGEGCLQFPVLFGMLAVKMNWNEKQVRENDPIVRYYVRNNPDWYVTRGAHGGIMRISDKLKKETEKSNKEAIKAKIKAEIEAKAALATSTPVSTDSTPSV